MAVKLKSMYKIAAPFIGGILAIQLIVTAVTVTVMSRQQTESTTERAAEYEKAAKGVVNAFLSSQDQLVSGIVAASPAVPNLNIPGVLEVRVLPPGGDIPTTLTFTQQDMLRRAVAQRGNISPEASHLPDGSLVFNQVRPLKDGGFLLVTTSMSDLKKAVEAVAGKGGLVLRQQIGKAGEKADILSLSPSGTGKTVSVSNSNWEMQIFPPAGQTDVLGLVLALLASALLLTPGLVIVMVRIYDRKISEDINVMHALTRSEEQTGALNLDVMQELWSVLIASAPQKPTLSGNIRTHDVAGIVQAAERIDSGATASLNRNEALQADSLPLDAPDSSEDVFAEAEKASNEPEALEFNLASIENEVLAADSGVPSRIFRDYDIRGNASTEITPALATQIGQAIATEARERGEQKIVVGYDARLTSEVLSQALIEGLVSAGCDVINIGMVPSPVLYYAARNIGTGSGVMVTASHNPAMDNGFKIVLGNHTLAGPEIRSLRERIVKADFAKGAGTVIKSSVTDQYLQQISDDVLLARTFNIVVDAGNGVAGPMVVRMLEDMGCTVSPLYCEPDGHFPHHDPDPCNPHNLEDLLSDVAISGADLGLAFDGDGDRVVVVTNSTRIIPSDKLLMLFAREVLATQPGADIIFDVKCTRDLVSMITTHGGRPVMSKTGHSWLKAAVAETGAPLAGEMSGHFIFNDRWQGFDDGLYAAARFLEILAGSEGTADDLFREFPERVATPELKIPLSDDHRDEVMRGLVEQAESITDGTINKTDGLRIEFAHGWGLVRPSNTGSYLVARFEGNDEQDLEAVKTRFRDMLIQADPMLLLPF